MKQGGKRTNAGRLPEFGTKGQERKEIRLQVPKVHHAKLVKVCKESIQEFLKQVL